MGTPNDGMTPYCTPAQFLERYDMRTVGDLLSDNDQRLTPNQVLNSPILASLLMEASGWLDAALFVAAKYTEDAIRSVVDKGGNGAEMIAGLVSGITMWLCFDRRPDYAAKHELPAKAFFAMEQMQLLRDGARVLPLPENEQAGLPLSAVLSPAQVWNQNLSTTEAFRYFGQRGNQISPPGFGRIM